MSPRECLGSSPAPGEASSSTCQKSSAHCTWVITPSFSARAKCDAKPARTWPLWTIICWTMIYWNVIQ